MSEFTESIKCYGVSSDRKHLVSVGDVQIIVSKEMAIRDAEIKALKDEVKALKKLNQECAQDCAFAKEEVLNLKWVLKEYESLADKYAEDYPRPFKSHGDVRWCIESTMSGIDAANKDLHKLISKLKANFHFTADYAKSLIEGE